MGGNSLTTLIILKNTNFTIKTTAGGRTKNETHYKLYFAQ